jgi:hypothetical protein
MTDVCVISVCEDACTRDGDWDEISRPVHGSAGSASLVVKRRRSEQFSNFWGTLTVITVTLILVIADFPLVSPRAFGVTSESMDEHNAAYGYYEIEAERYKWNLL